MKPRAIDEQVALLMQGTEYGGEALQAAMAGELRKRLLEADREGRRLRVYCGFDPRTSDLHLGHTVPMRKLRQFQELGHEVIFLIGRFTSLIGDPSDKDKLRPQLSPEETARNAETYAQQAFKILDPPPEQLAGLYRDAEAAYDYLVRERGIGPRSIVPFGQSLGTAVAADLASKREVGALILEAPFASSRGKGAMR